MKMKYLNVKLKCSILTLRGVDFECISTVCSIAMLIVIVEALTDCRILPHPRRRSPIFSGKILWDLIPPAPSLRYFRFGRRRALGKVQQGKIQQLLHRKSTFLLEV